MKPRKPGVPARDVPPERKALHHAGMAVGVAGFLLFISTIFAGSSDHGRSGGLEGRIVGGMVLIFAGSAMVRVAAQGLAGSGLTLSPEQARRDMEPWSRMGGGMLADALDEIPAVRPPDERVLEVVRIRCPHCRALNDESDRFCGQCGGRV